jgi:hypothetical protein
VRPPSGSVGRRAAAPRQRGRSGPRIPLCEELGQGKLVPAADEGHDPGRDNPRACERYGDPPEDLPRRVAVHACCSQHSRGKPGEDADQQPDGQGRGGAEVSRNQSMPCTEQPVTGVEPEEGHRKCHRRIGAGRQHDRMHDGRAAKPAAAHGVGGGRGDRKSEESDHEGHQQAVSEPGPNERGLAIARREQPGEVGRRRGKWHERSWVTQQGDGRRQGEEEEPVERQERPEDQKYDTTRDAEGTGAPRNDAGSTCRGVAVRSQTALLGDG